MAYHLTNIVQHRLLNLNKNWLCIVCGDTGSGKTYLAISLAEKIDRNFNIRNVVFTPEEFMKLLNSKRLKKGSCIIFDEAGVGMPSRDWYSIQNKLLSFVLQTFRHKNLAVIFTTPSLSFIDIHARMLFHNYIETQSINRKKEVCITKLMNIEMNPRNPKKPVYMKYPRIWEKGKIVVVQRHNISKPSERIIKSYETKKINYTKHLNQDILETLQTQKDKNEYFKRKYQTDDAIFEEAERVFKNYDGKVTIPVIRNELNVSMHKASQIRQHIQKKSLS